MRIITPYGVVSVAFSYFFIIHLFGKRRGSFHRQHVQTLRVQLAGLHTLYGVQGEGPSWLFSYLYPCQVNGFVQVPTMHGRPTTQIGNP